MTVAYFMVQLPPPGATGVLTAPASGPASERRPILVLDFGPRDSASGFQRAGGRIQPNSGLNNFAGNAHPG